MNRKLKFLVRSRAICKFLFVLERIEGWGWKMRGRDSGEISRGEEFLDSFFSFFFLRHLNKTAFLTKVEAGDVISESGVRYKRVQGWKNVNGIACLATGGNLHEKFSISSHRMNREQGGKNRYSEIKDWFFPFFDITNKISMKIFWTDFLVHPIDTRECVSWYWSIRA